jgi:hypothetical protein
MVYKIRNRSINKYKFGVTSPALTIKKKKKTKTGKKDRHLKANKFDG